MPKPAPAATTSPTNLEIAWAAGVYEGEGTFIAVPANKTCYVNVTQLDRWLLDQLVTLFGGKIHNIKTPKGKACFRWTIYGARARGFVLTLYSFLSPRRQGQIRTVLCS